MFKYQIIKGVHRVYDYADKAWHEFNDRQKAFNYMIEIIGG